MHIQNMTNSKGNKVKNQFLVTGVPAGIYNSEGEHIPSGVMFQSYNSIIAFRDFIGQVWLDRNRWDYSATTGRYRNEFLNEGIAETRKKIASGEYKLVTFND